MFIIDKLYINSCDLLPYACLSWYMLRCTQIIEEFRETPYPDNGRWVLNAVKMLTLIITPAKRPCFWFKTYHFECNPFCSPTMTNISSVSALQSMGMRKPLPGSRVLIWCVNRNYYFFWNWCFNSVVTGGWMFSKLNLNNDKLS